LFPFRSEETEPLEKLGGLPQNTHLTFVKVPAVNHRVSEPPKEGRARAGTRASHFHPGLCGEAEIEQVDAFGRVPLKIIEMCLM